MHVVNQFFALLPGICIVSTASATVVLDVDPVSPGVQSSITIPIGTTLRITAIEDSSLFPPPDRDRVGVDLYYQLPGDVPTTPVPSALDGDGNPSVTHAGALVGFSGSGSATDLFLPSPAIGPVIPGTGLVAGPLGPAFGYLQSIGGVGYTARPTGLDFPDVFPIDLMSWEFDFTVVGSVHLGICGILDGADGSPTLVPGNVYHEMNGNIAFPTVCGPGVVVNVVPEPATGVLAALVTLGGVFRRNRLE